MHDDDADCSSPLQDNYEGLGAAFRRVIEAKLKHASKMTLGNLDYLLDIADKVHSFEMNCHNTDSIIEKRRGTQIPLAVFEELE